MSEDTRKLSDNELDVASGGENIQEDDNPSKQTGKTRSGTPSRCVYVFEDYEAPDSWEVGYE